MHKIIVGVDGSDHGSVALRWAARLGERRGVEVVAVLAWNYFDHGYREPGEELQPIFGEPEARKVLDDAVDLAGGDLNVTRQTINEPVPEALVETAGHDDLIVVGARGLGGFKGLLLGSVSQRVLELARCPVAVVHGEEAATRTGTIVVGYDGSPGSMGAVRWGAEQAAATGEPLRVVHAWQVPAYTEVASSQALDALAAAADRQVADALQDPSLEGLSVTSRGRLRRRRTRIARQPGRRVDDRGRHAAGGAPSSGSCWGRRAVRSAPTPPSRSWSYPTRRREGGSRRRPRATARVGRRSVALRGAQDAPGAATAQADRRSTCHRA